MKKPKNIPTYYESTGTPIYRDTTGLPFNNGGGIEPNDKLGKRILKRYPGMQGVYGPEGENLTILKDPNYAAAEHGFGNIEFIFPGSGIVNYSDDYQYQSPTPNNYTAVYNPKGANKHDVFLDMTHGMRDDLDYMTLLGKFAEETKKARGASMDHWYNYDLQNNPYAAEDGREAWDNNFIDGVLRSHLAKKGMGRFSSDVKGYRKERQGSSPEMKEAANEIYKYLKGKPNKLLDGGPLVDKTDHGKLLNSVYASALGNYYAQGGMIKRADGSYSQRGLWDNIRANKGSGKEPTKQMLEQERKINREYRNGGQFPTPYSLPEDSFKQGGRNLHNSVYASSLAQYPAVYKYGGSFEMPRQQMYMPLDNVERYGGQQQNAKTFSVEGENHKVYLKTSSTGNGEGVQGHIMVNHPTKNKGQWDTIDLTQKAGAKTVAQGVAATKQWHAEHPNNYRDGGSVFYATNTPQLEGEGKDLTYPDGAYVYGNGGVVKTSHLFGPGGPINPTTQQSLAQFLNPEFQKIVQGREVTVRPSAYQLQQANRTTNNYDPLLVKNLPSETTQKVAKQSMQAKDLNQVVKNVERANTIKNQTDPGHLYKTMTDKQISNIISPELKKEAQAAVDRRIYPTLAIAQRDLLMGQEANKVRSAQNPLAYYPNYGYKDPRQSGPWNNYNDGAIESADWVWSLPLGVRALPSALEGLGVMAAKEIPFLGTSVGTVADIYGGVEGTKSLVDAIGAHRQGNTAERNSALLNAGLNLAIPGIQKINAARKPVTALEKRLADQWGTPEWEEATGRTINYPSLKGPTKATKENFSNPMQSDYDKFLKQTTKKLEDDYIKGIPYGTEDELQDKAQDAAVDMLFAKYGKSNVVNWMHNDMYGPLKKYGNFKNFEYKKQAKEIDEYEKGLEKLEKEPLNELITFNSKSNISGIPQTKFSNLEGALKDEFRLNALSDYLPKLGKKKVVPDFTPIPLEPLPKLESFTLPKTGFSDLEKEIYRQADDYVTLATSAKNYERAAALDKEYGTEYVKALDNLAKHKDATAAIGKLPLNIKVVPNEGTGAGGWSTFTPEGRAKLIMYNEGFGAYKPTIFDREIAVVEGNDLSDMARVVPHEIKHHYTLGQDINFYKNQYGEQLSDMLNNPGEISRTNPVLADELIQPAFKDDTRSLFEYFEDPKEIDAYINTNLRDDLVKQKVLKDHWDELTQEKVAEYLMKNPHKYSKKYLDMVKDPEFIKMFNKGVYSLAPLGVGTALVNSKDKKEFKKGGTIRTVKSSQLL